MATKKYLTDPPIEVGYTTPTMKRAPLASRPTWLEIDRAALINNVRRLREIIGGRRLLMGVIKANAYGHGATTVAPALVGAGVDRFAVATLDEAVELRGAGVHAPILVLGYMPTWQAEEAVAQQVTATIYDMETAAALAAAAAGQNRSVTVHVKVNTGMNRLGLAISAVPAFLAHLKRYPRLYVEGLFTHFGGADLADKQSALLQYAGFARLLEGLTQTGLRPAIAHAANSAATLTLPQTHLDMVRCGIALYGLHPDDPQTRLPEGFRPALSWKAQIAQVRRVGAGDSVGYGGEYVAASPRTLAVIPVGYGDGFPRAPHHWRSVLVRGAHAPIVGRVCMDQTIIDVTENTAGGAVCQGDEVVLIGRQGGATLSAEEVARRLGTINYDVVSRILGRVPRVGVGEEG